MLQNVGPEQWLLEIFAVLHPTLAMVEKGARSDTKIGALCNLLGKVWNWGSKPGGAICFAEELGVLWPQFLKPSAFYHHFYGLDWLVPPVMLGWQYGSSSLRLLWLPWWKHSSGDFLSLKFQLGIIYWLVVYLPLWNMTSSDWDDEIPNWMEKYKNVPNHQPVIYDIWIYDICIFRAYICKPTDKQTKKQTDKQTDREADTQQTNKEEHIKINYCIYIYKCVCACNYIYIYIKHYKRSSPHSRDCQPHTNHRMHSKRVAIRFSRFASYSMGPLAHGHPIKSRQVRLANRAGFRGWNRCMPRNFKLYHLVI